MKNKYNKKIYRLFEKCNINTPNCHMNYSKILAYIIVILLGLIFITVSFYFEDNWMNVFLGVGSGILTSSFVSITLNIEIDAREKRKRKEMKDYLFNNIIVTSLDVYADIIYRINEFITLTNTGKEANLIYGLYDDFTKFIEFENNINKIDLDDCSNELADRYNQLFDINNLKLIRLIVELKYISKQEFYLRGILTSEECSNLISNVIKEKYLQVAENLDDFWNDRKLNKEKCILFLRSTIYICSQTIATFDYAKKKAKYLEEDISEKIATLHFNEVHCKGDEYILEQLARNEAEILYNAEHPDEMENLQQSSQDIENVTEEDQILFDLYWCIFGFGIDKIEDFIKKLDVNSEVVINFFKDDKIRIALKKERKLKKVIIAKFGKNILK